MYLLIPGRHHLLTSFQFEYLSGLVSQEPAGRIDVFGKRLRVEGPIEGFVFAVTSANHAGTKRNPIPFHLRAMTIHEFSRTLDCATYVFGINDVGHLEDFASYTLKTIWHESENRLHLTPENTAVVCSTPVMDMYAKLGFQILPAELEDKSSQSFRAPLPWELVERIAASDDWSDNPDILRDIHSSTFNVWRTYALGKKVRSILNDPIVGSDGDITDSRDYSSYVRQMDEIAEIKFKETAPFIRPGRIGDIGCAVGSWIRLASQDRALGESDFYGIELARALFDVCQQRKHNGEFRNPSVFFSMKNAVEDLVFQPNSMDTIHASSLTHEIESYGSRKDLLAFIANRYRELAPGGVWINRDVVGPEDGDTEIWMQLASDDGRNDEPFAEFDSRADLASHLDGLSTLSLFLRFARDFRRSEGDPIEFETVDREGVAYIRLKYRDACEFLLTKDYTDNWRSEMHETFCYWSFRDWEAALVEAGFRIHPASNAYQNPWIAKNRWEGKAVLVRSLDDPAERLSPPTNMLLIGEKI